MNKNRLLILSLLLTAGLYADDGWGKNGISLENSKIVSSTGFETNIKNVANNPTIITAQDIKIKNYQTVGDILKSIPAVNIINQDGEQIIDLRGQGEKAKTNVKILVDGVPLNSLDTSMTPTPINTLDVNTIERIEVIPGGGAVLYGSGTSGGVVNIITKSGEGFRGNVGYRNSQFGGHNYTASIGETIGKFDFDFDYARENRNGYRDYDETKSDYFQGKITYNIDEDNKLMFKYSKFKSDDSYPAMLEKNQLNDPTQWGREPGDTSTVNTDKDEFLLKYDTKINENLDFNISTFHQKTTLDLKSQDSYNPKLKSYSKMKAIFEDKKWGIKPILKYKYGEGSSIVFGLDYIHNTLLRDVNVNPMPFMRVNTLNDLKKETFSGFVHNTYRYDKFEFIQGVRYEKSKYSVSRKKSVNSKNKPGIDTDKDMNNYALELAVNYLYSDSGNSYLKFERGFTTPAPALLTNLKQVPIKYSKNSNSRYPSKTVGEYYPNNLKAETFDTFEFGIKDYIWDSYVSATTFYTITKDEITSETIGGMPPKEINNYNLGKTKRYGFEFSAQQWIGKLTLSQSYNFIKTKIIDGKMKSANVDYSGNEVAEVPQNKFNLGARYDFTSSFNANIDVIYTGKSYLNNANKGGKQNDRTITNIVANYNMSNGLRLYAGINNLFNDKYYNNIDYDIKDKKYTYDPASTRNYFIGFDYSF